VLLDASGPPFATAVTCRPDIIKPNIGELRELVGAKLEDASAMAAAARELIATGIGLVAVSMGPNGALFAEGDSAVLALPPRIRIESTVGAGDAMVAGIITGTLHGLDLADRARLATAFSLAALGEIGPHLPPRAAVEAYLERVEVRPVTRGYRPGEAMAKIAAVTSCPTGIAHSLMAAEALKKTAALMEHDLKVEIHGAEGTTDRLSLADIAAADLVLIAADIHVDDCRFAGKPIYKTSVGAAVKGAKKVITSGKTQSTAMPGAVQAIAAAPTASAGRKTEGPYKHLLTGVSHMLPTVVAGGLCIALSFVFGIEAFKQEGTLPAALMQMGGGAAFKITIPVLSCYIAYSIADRPGLAPGLIGGLLTAGLQAGFIGDIISGFIADYTALFLREKIRLPQNLEGLKPVLVIPLLSTLVVGLLMIYVVGTPIKAIMEGLTLRYPH
jgi:fructose-specific phosphotransferase system IIB component